MRNEGRQDATDALLRWEPSRYVRKMEPFHVKLSRGFARCKPQKWFPGFAAQWLPLFHSLNVEGKVLSVQPELSVPTDLDVVFEASVDDEPLMVALSSDAAQVISETCAGERSTAADKILVEYMIRRLLSTLALAWTGPESSVVRFVQRVDPSAVQGAGSVTIQAQINNRPLSVVLVLGKGLMTRLDWLWRRQLHAQAKATGAPVVANIELAQLAVPPSMLGDYTRTGTVVDLEIPLSDTLALRLGGKPWMPARMCNVDGRLGFEMIAGPVPNPIIPDGTTRLTIQLGSVELDSATVSELGQVGAMFETELPLTDRVELLINGEMVATAKLCSYEGRFAMNVD